MWPQLCPRGCSRGRDSQSHCWPRGFDGQHHLPRVGSALNASLSSGEPQVLPSCWSHCAKNSLHPNDSFGWIHDPPGCFSPSLNHCGIKDGDPPLVGSQGAVDLHPEQPRFHSEGKQLFLFLQLHVPRVCVSTCTVFKMRMGVILGSKLPAHGPVLDVSHHMYRCKFHLKKH